MEGTPCKSVVIVKQCPSVDFYHLVGLCAPFLFNETTMNKIGKSSVRLAFLTLFPPRAAHCSTHQTAIPRGSEVMGRKPNRKSKKRYLPTLPRGSVVKRPSTPSYAKRLEVFASYLRLLLSLFQSLPGSNRCLGPGSLP